MAQQSGTYIFGNLRNEGQYAQDIKDARRNEVRAGRDLALGPGEDLRAGIDDAVGFASGAITGIGNQMIADKNMATNENLAQTGRFLDAENNLAEQDSKIAMLQRQVKRAGERRDVAENGTPMKATATQNLWLLEDQLEMATHNRTGLQTTVDNMRETKSIQEFMEKRNSKRAERTMGMMAANRQKGSPSEEIEVASLQTSGADPQRDSLDIAVGNAKAPAPAAGPPGFSPDVWSKIESTIAAPPPKKTSESWAFGGSGNLPGNNELVDISLNTSPGSASVDMSKPGKTSVDVMQQKPATSDPWDVLTGSQPYSVGKRSGSADHDRKVVEHVNVQLGKMGIPPLDFQSYIFFTNKHGSDLSAQDLIMRLVEEWQLGSMPEGNAP